MIIRRMKPGEEQSLFDVFYSSIHHIAANDYSPIQINTWAPLDFDMDLWVELMQKNNPFVAEIKGILAGYADLQANGYIDHFFVSPNYARSGIGSALMRRILIQARCLGITTLSSNVSKTAEPFFKAHGFFIVERKMTKLRGVDFENTLRHKHL